MSQNTHSVICCQKHWCIQQHCHESTSAVTISLFENWILSCLLISVYLLYAFKFICWTLYHFWNLHSLYEAMILTDLCSPSLVRPAWNVLLQYQCCFSCKCCCSELNEDHWFFVIVLFSFLVMNTVCSFLDQKPINYVYCWIAFRKI